MPNEELYFFSQKKLIFAVKGREVIKYEMDFSKPKVLLTNLNEKMMQQV